jgi:hypothetical protein
VLPLLLIGCIGLEMVPYPGVDGGGSVGDVALDLSSIDFGDVPVGETAEETLTLTNGAARPSMVRLEVDDPYTFLVSTSEVTVEDDSVVRIGFVPANDVTYEGVLTVTTEDGAALDVPLLGTGTDGSGGGGGSGSGPNLDLSATSHAFGAVDLGDTETTTFTVTNDGDDDLRIDSIAVAGGPFSTGGSLAEGQVISPGASKVLEVSFRPTVEQAYNGSVTIGSDDPDSPETVISLSGSGADQCDICAPVIEVDVGSAITDFFSIAGVLEDERTVTIRNAGDLPLTVDEIRVKDDDWAPCGSFTIGGFRSAVTLDPGDRSTFTITYTATDVCVESANGTLDWNIVHIESNDPDIPDWTIELGGIGVG